MKDFAPKRKVCKRFRYEFIAYRKITQPDWIQIPKFLNFIIVMSVDDNFSLLGAVVETNQSGIRIVLNFDGFYLGSFRCDVMEGCD